LKTPLRRGFALLTGTSNSKKREIMAVIELSEENFEETINNNDFVIVDFWAQWCGPCKSFAPTYEKISAEFPDIVFGKVNTEEEQGIAAHFQIRSIPTLMMFREQIIIYSEAGALPEMAFKDVVERASDLDMAKVREQIAEEQTKKA
jgi:thioredoxin 1